MNKHSFHNLLKLALLSLLCPAQLLALEYEGLEYEPGDGLSAVVVAKADGTKYSGDITIPAYISRLNKKYKVVAVSKSAFADCTELTSVVFANNSYVTTIEESAFKSCTKLSSVTLPSNLTSIGAQAFRSCSALISLALPSGVTSIGESAFEECRSLPSVTIPAGVRSLPTKTFSGCKKLAQVMLPESLQTIGASAFSGCSSLSSIALPKSLVNLGEGAFSDTGLEKLVFPASISTVPSNAFSFCNALRTVVFEEGVQQIAKDAFLCCHILNTITVPPSLTEIADGAFTECELIRSLRLFKTVPGDLRVNVKAFGGRLPYELVLYVPTGCEEAYQKASPWSQCAQIQTLPELTLTPTAGQLQIVCDEPHDQAKFELKNVKMSTVSTGTTGTDLIALPHLISCDAEVCAFSAGCPVAIAAVPVKGNASSSQPGDVNGDEKVNLADLTALIKLLQKK